MRLELSADPPDLRRRARVPTRVDWRRRGRRMGRSAGLAILFAALAVVAPLIAAAHVPDPTWVGGFYDGADGDELCALVWDQSPALVVDGVVVAVSSPTPAYPLPQDSPPAAVRALRRAPRAPPLA